MTEQNFWVTADIHFFHRNIPKFCPEARGMFVDKIPQMNATIIKRWNELVQYNDTVFILGDVSFGHPEETVQALLQMNGFKILITGNHDHKMLKNAAFVAQFTKVMDYHVQMIDGKRVVMFHYPIYEWDGMHRGNIHLHGHLHGTPHGIEGRIKDVGMDTNDLRPYNLRDLIAKMEKLPIRSHGSGGDL